eukprot:SAG31_NODE_69_length_28130_cov_15.318219_5_plen_141_part_00
MLAEKKRPAEGDHRLLREKLCHGISRAIIGATPVHLTGPSVDRSVPDGRLQKRFGALMRKIRSTHSCQVGITDEYGVAYVLVCMAVKVRCRHVDDIIPWESINIAWPEDLVVAKEIFETPCSTRHKVVVHPQPRRAIIGV